MNVVAGVLAGWCMAGGMELGVFGSAQGTCVSEADMCQDPKKIRDAGSAGSGILEDPGSYTFIFLWNVRDHGCGHGNIVVGS